MNSCLCQLACLSFVFLAASGYEDCDPNTGPAGVTHCYLNTPHYSKYQCATCLTDAYITQRSKGRQGCRDRTATYCQYQCMVERYGLDRGRVYDDCLCDPNRTLAQPSVILPAACYSPDGTDCDWYHQCLAKMFPCRGQAEYAISYREKFCNLYTQTTLEFSQQALQWINATRKCLQVALVPALHRCQVQPTCEQLKAMAFKSHVPCYVDPYRGFSVCNLSPTDWTKIFWTIKGSFLPGTFVETFKASLFTAANCTPIWSVQLAKYLFSLSVELRRAKRDSNDTLSDDELAHDILLHMSSSLHWSQDSTIDWYAFAVNTSAIQDNTSAIQESLTTPSADQPGRQLIIQLFVTDRVDIGLLNVNDATGRRRLNKTITQLADVIKQGLTGTVDNFRFGVTSLRRCASGQGINDGCSTGPVVATGQPDLRDSVDSGNNVVAVSVGVSVTVSVSITISVSVAVHLKRRKKNRDGN